jgi:hypothetical protein
MHQLGFFSILVTTEEVERVFPWKKSLTWLNEAISHSLERRKMKREGSVNEGETEVFKVKHM